MKKNDQKFWKCESKTSKKVTMFFLTKRTKGWKMWKNEKWVTEWKTCFLQKKVFHQNKASKKSKKKFEQIPPKKISKRKKEKFRNLVKCSTSVPRSSTSVQQVLNEVLNEVFNEAFNECSTSVQRVFNECSTECEDVFVILGNIFPWRALLELEAFVKCHMRAERATVQSQCQQLYGSVHDVSWVQQCVTKKHKTKPAKHEQKWKRRGAGWWDEEEGAGGLYRSPRHKRKHFFKTLAFRFKKKYLFDSKGCVSKSWVCCLCVCHVLLTVKSFQATWSMHAVHDGKWNTGNMRVTRRVNMKLSASHLSSHGLSWHDGYSNNCDHSRHLWYSHNTNSRSPALHDTKVKSRAARVSSRHVRRLNQGSLRTTCRILICCGEESTVRNKAQRKAQCGPTSVPTWTSVRREVFFCAKIPPHFFFGVTDKNWRKNNIHAMTTVEKILKTMSISSSQGWWKQMGCVLKRIASFFTFWCTLFSVHTCVII